MYVCSDDHWVCTICVRSCGVGWHTHLGRTEPKSRSTYQLLNESLPRTDIADATAEQMNVQVYFWDNVR
eukprot:scaffold252303_cov52-Prasinocladus_malaysianus.AAC.1